MKCVWSILDSGPVGVDSLWYHHIWRFQNFARRPIKISRSFFLFSQTSYLRLAKRIDHISWLENCKFYPSAYPPVREIDLLSLFHFLYSLSTSLCTLSLPLAVFNLSKSINQFCFQKRGYSGMMPVHMSALNGYTECVKKFLTSETEIDVTDGRGRTALHCAACSGNIACLDLLLSAGKLLFCCPRRNIFRLGL